jgi:hypothetical protein
MTGGFDPARFTAAPLQVQGLIRFPRITSDLRITRVSPCVAREPKTGASFMFAGS